LLLEEPRGAVGVELIDDRAVDGHRGDPGVELLDVGEGERRTVEGEAHLRPGLAAELGAATGVGGIAVRGPGAGEAERGIGVLVGARTDGGRWRWRRRWRVGDDERVEEHEGPAGGRVLVARDGDD